MLLTDNLFTEQVILLLFIIFLFKRAYYPKERFFFSSRGEALEGFSGLTGYSTLVSIADLTLLDKYPHISCLF